MKFDERGKEIRKDPKLFDLLKEEEEKEGEEEHAEKVRSCTKHEASRKISKNIELFTRKEIEEGKLNFKNLAMMRIAVKLCQELRAVFDDTKERKEQFRMKNGKQQFLRC